MGIGKVLFHRSVRLAAQFDTPYFEGLLVALLTSMLFVRLSSFCFGMLPINQQYFFYIPKTFFITTLDAFSDLPLRAILQYSMDDDGLEKTKLLLTKHMSTVLRRL